MGGRNNMELKRLGNTSLKVAPLAFGGNVFGWTVDDEKGFQLLDGFVGVGFNLIDTANSYSRWAPGNKGGESETLIGKWMKERRNRDKVVIATKVGSDMGAGKRDISRTHILQAAEDSLRRLQTDYIDLYQTHWDDGTTPIEETLEAYSQLIKGGKVRYIGASNLPPEKLVTSLDASKKEGYPRYETLQPEYNLYDREKFEKNYEDICRNERLAVLPYYSLASGFLTGKYRSEADLSKSKRGGGIKKYLNEKGFRILAALDKVAKEYDSTPASIALAWLVANPVVAAPIASATTIKQLESLTRGVTLKLNRDAKALLDEASIVVQD